MAAVSRRGYLVTGPTGGLPDTLPNPPEDQRQEQDRHPLADDYSRQGTIVIHWSRPHHGLEAVISPHCARRFDTLP
jgi:hypothetical protein